MSVSYIPKVHININITIFYVNIFNFITQIVQYCLMIGLVQAYFFRLCIKI